MAEQRSNDEALLARMREGDEEAFISLYHRWQRSIYCFALQMSGSPATAEDVTQETFLAIIRDSSGFRPSRGSLRAYLYGIARHMILRMLEREKPATVFGEQMLQSVACSMPAAGSDPHQTLLRNQRVERLRAAVLALPVHYREVVVLCELHEQDYAEVARVLGCSIGTVRSRLHRGRALLAERLRSSGLERAGVEAIGNGRCAL